MVSNDFERQFKTSPVGRRVRCRVTPNGAEVLHARSGRQIAHCKFGDVHYGRFSEFRMSSYGLGIFGRQMVSRTRRLAGRYRDFNLMQNYGDYKSPLGIDLDPYYEVCTATLRGLAAANPDARIEVGPGMGVRWTLFVIGMIALLIGLLCLFAVFGAWIDPNVMSGDDVWGVGVIGVLMIPVGMSAAVGFHPWKERETVAAALLADDIESRIRTRR